MSSIVAHEPAGLHGLHLSEAAYLERKQKSWMLMYFSTMVYINFAASINEIINFFSGQQK